MILAALFLAAALPAAAVDAAKDPELIRRINRGIDAIYKMEFDDCEKTFQELAKDYPGLPYAYFGLATASWARFEYEEEESNIARHHEFEQRIDDAIERGKEWVKANPNDAAGMVCVSGMYGMRARLALMLHKWVRAYWEGRKALALAHRVVEINPNEADVYTGLGMWDYYTDTLPGVVKVLGRIVSIRGNAKRGIERLKLAAEKDTHTSTAAKLILIELMQDKIGPYYLPKEGLRMIREVRQKFPMNPLFHFVEVIYLFENQLADETEAEATRLVKGIEEGRKYYHLRYKPRALVGLASAHFLRKDWAKSEAVLTEAVNILEAEKKHNRWGLWALIRRGQTKDVRGQRDAALADYKLALKHLDYWDLHDIAKLHLKQPATEADLLGTPMPPP